MMKLKVAGRYLACSDGSPFFYLGDTAWELFHRLSREEIAYYMAERARQGFNAVQAVALSEFEGVTEPNVYGRLPLLFTADLPDPCRPDEEEGYNYWQHVDFAVREAEKHNLFITMLPTWGDKFNQLWGKGPVIFNRENAYTYGKWIGKRYRDNWNIIWMLGGDRPLEKEHRAVIDAMAEGIKAGDEGGHLITFHPPGGHNSTEYTGDVPYIDFHTSQTGHGARECYFSWLVMESMAAATDKPYMDSEPRYEDHPACFKVEYGYLWNEDDVRQNAYWDVLSGACGHTYGNHSIWSFNRTKQEYYPYLWNEALLHPGAEQIGFVKKLRESRDYFSYKPMPDLTEQNGALSAHIASGAGKGYAMAYSPLGLPFVVHGDKIKSLNLRASWFDPRTGGETVFGIYPSGHDIQFVPPTQGKGRDWVLILDELA